MARQTAPTFPGSAARQRIMTISDSSMGYYPKIARSEKAPFKKT
jgi:hypothetical protein